MCSTPSAEASGRSFELFCFRSVWILVSFGGEMEGRMKKYRQVSPERTKVWTEPSPKHYNRKVPVVYYLSRNRHLEHPHFIEVPLSSPQGLYLKDVIDRLNVLRGRGMPSMYSWSCKRNYKNGYVWHDLSEDDLILPAQGNEYVLKGSELLEECHSDRLHPGSNTKLQNLKQLPEPVSSRSQEVSSSFSSMVVRDSKPSQEDETSSPLQRPGSSGMSPESIIGKNPSCGSSRSLIEYKIYKEDGAADASTQTEECARRCNARETCTRGVSTDDGSQELECNENHQNQTHQEKNSVLCRGEISPPPSSSSTSSSGGKIETLESLMKADASKMNSFRILDEDEIRMASHTKLKASNVIMQLISCGSISVKDHSFGLIPTYRPRFSHSKFPSPLLSSSMLLGELDCFSENPRVMSMRLEDKEYFSGSLVEVKAHKDEGDGFATLKRSSSYNDDRTCKTSNSAEEKEESASVQLKCIPRSIKASLTKQPQCETMRSPMSDGPRNSSAGDVSQNSSLNPSHASSKRSAEHSSGRKPSVKLDSFREEKEKIIKIEERLSSGARVIIQSTACMDD